MSAIFTTEAIRLAMELNDTTEVTREMVRDAYEQLEFTDETFVSLGMEGFLPQMAISCENHSGPGLVAMKQWNAQIRRWEQLTDYYEPDSALIDPQVETASAAFAETAGMTRQGC